MQSDLAVPMMSGAGGGHSSGGSGSGGGGSFHSSHSSGHEEMMAPPPRVGSPPPGGWSQGSSGSGGSPQAKWPTWTGGVCAVSGNSGSGELRDHVGGQMQSPASTAARPRIRSDASDTSVGSFGSIGSLRFVPHRILHIARHGVADCLTLLWPGREDWGDLVGEGSSVELRQETL